ncbi:MAG TPA: hypothetical protein VNZ52_04820 [Candidatus Thermoplasmatota archaeon]|nr:hypothetical protein [Candidatus Thermoplasmatota archaeon]
MHRRTHALILLLALLAVPAVQAQSVGGQEGMNTSESGGQDVPDEDGQGDVNIGPQQGGGDPQNVGGFNARPGSSFWGLLVVLGLVGIAFLIYRRRGGRLNE